MCNPKAPQMGGAFDPEGAGYDYATAMRWGMGPDGTGENAGHWGSVAPADPADIARHGLPQDSYVMLKGKTHPTWNLGVEGEMERDSRIVQKGPRYYSIPGTREGRGY